MNHFRGAPSLIFAVIAMSASASATTINYDAGTNLATVNVADQSTNFSNVNVQIPLFNPSIICTTGFTCTLNSVFIVLTGDVTGSAKFESLDASSVTVTTNLSAKIALSRPTGGTIVVTLPDATASTVVTAYDGNIDFSGASGRTFSAITKSDTQSATLTSALDLALFTGSGMLALPVSAMATSSGSGSGNLITQFSTQAGASVAVIYDYAETAVTTTPEPATFAMLGGALVGLGLLRRRPTR